MSTEEGGSSQPGTATDQVYLISAASPSQTLCGMTNPFNPAGCFTRQEKNQIKILLIGCFVWM
jgi:hypothetical protein